MTTIAKAFARIITTIDRPTLPPDACWIHPTANGLANPARLPSELITATPLAAPAPARNEVGSVQNRGFAVCAAMVATLIAANASSGVPRLTAVTTKATTDTPSAIWTGRAERSVTQRPVRYMQTDASRNGTADSQPTCRSVRCSPTFLITDGSQ